MVIFSTTLIACGEGGDTDKVYIFKNTRRIFDACKVNLFCSLNSISLPLITFSPQSIFCPMVRLLFNRRGYETSNIYKFKSFPHLCCLKLYLMSFESYSSDNQHCILVENVKTIDEKQIDLYVLFGQLAYVNYCYISQNYYFLVYLDCRDAKKALPCIGKMTMLNGVTGKRVTTRFASIDEIVDKCHDPQLYTRLSATVNIKYFQGYSQHNLNHMDIRILHHSFGEVSHCEWLAPDALSLTYFSITSKVKALAQLNKDYAEMGIPVAVKDGGDVKLFQPKMLFSPSVSSITNSVFSGSTSTSSVSSLIHPMSQLQYTPPHSLKQKHKLNKRQNGKRNEIVVYKMLNGMDTRTTLMLKNIPNRYTQKMMIDFLNETLQGQFDFLYLRMDYEVLLTNVEPL